MRRLTSASSWVYCKCRVSQDSDTMAKHQLPKNFYTLPSNAEVRRSYDDCTARYDRTLPDEIGYVAPQISAAALADQLHGLQRRRPVLDLACGTGLVAEHLTVHGFTQIDGVDYSAGMLAEATQKSIYRHLLRADLNRALTLADDSYAAAICVGALSDNHILPAALREFVRVAEPGGVLLVTMNEHSITEYGYGEHFDALVTAGLCEQLSQQRQPYHEKGNIFGYVAVFRVLG